MIEQLLLRWRTRQARHKARMLILRTLRLPRDTSERHAIMMARYAISSSEMMGKPVPPEIDQALDTLTR